VPRNYHNHGGPSALPEGAPRDAARAEFARRLSAAMIQKGWNQSELARRASDHYADKEIGRDSISVYMRGKALPTPLVLNAIAAALGVDPADLLPSRGVPSASAASPKMEAKDMGDGTVWLRVNQQVPWQVALTIMAALQHDERMKENDEQERKNGT